MEKPNSKTPQAFAAIRRLKRKLNTFHRTGYMGHWWMVEAAYHDLWDILNKEKAPHESGASVPSSSA